MFHDARGERGPYRAVRAQDIWFCMVHEDQDDPHPDVLRSGGLPHARMVAAEHMDDLRRVAWASGRSLRAGLDARGVGWLPVLPY